MIKVFKVVGSIATILAIVGFLTVADDLRHTGELIGVSSLLVGGVALMIAGWSSRMRRIMALQLLAVGLAAGALCGAAMDSMALGVTVGLAAGLTVSYLRRARTTRRVAR